jgi:hypothetical protein
VVELKVHLCQRLLHVLDMRGRIFEQTLALTHVCTQHGDLAFGPKAGTQQTVRMKPLEPLRIADIALASGHVLGIARIDEEHRKATGVEQLENRNPIHAGRLHNDRLDAAFCKPIHQPVQIGRKGTEAAHRLRRAVCSYGSHVHRRPRCRSRLRSDGPSASSGRAWFLISSGSCPILLLTRAEGLGCAI